MDALYACPKCGTEFLTDYFDPDVGLYREFSCEECGAKFMVDVTVNLDVTVTTIESEDSK